MTDLRQAAEQALDILEGNFHVLVPEDRSWQTIKALRAALEQSQPEPVAWFNRETRRGSGGWEETFAGDPNGFPVYATAPAQAEPQGWADKAMELATDFGVESLRVGSSERHDNFMNNGVATWKTVALREKREAARERLREHLYAVPAPAQAEPVAWCLKHSRGLEFNSRYPMCRTKAQAEQMAREHLGNLTVVALYEVAPAQAEPQELVITESDQRANRIWQRLAWLEKGQGIDVGEFVADVRAMLREAPAQAEPELQSIEQYRMQMAGISTAALGYWKEGDDIHPDYDTPALRDVARLYAKYAALSAPAPTQAEPTKSAKENKEDEPGDARDAALELLDVMFTAYENGPTCYEDPDEHGGHLGQAIKLDDDTFHRIVDLLNKHRPRVALSAAPAQAEPRKPLTNVDIHARFAATYRGVNNTALAANAFESGVLWAEQQHGITGEKE